VAENVRYQVTRVGNGFHGPGQRWLGGAINRARLRLRRMDGPYHFRGNPERQYRRKDILKKLKAQMRNGKVGDKFVILCKNYDQPGVATRIIEDKPDEHPFVTEGRKYLGGTRYVFGAIPSLPLPTTADCSGFVLRVIDKVSGFQLPHSANLQMQHDRIFTFRDADDLKSGDLVFYNFGRLPSGQADDVTMVVQPGQQIGARPSRNGVTIFDMGPERGYVICYGRFKG
jgi:hypothetical protein